MRISKKYWPLQRSIVALLIILGSLYPHAFHRDITTTQAKAHSNVRNVHLRINDRPAPNSRHQGYVRPHFAQTMQQLQPQILAAAARHNKPELSTMSDEEFAVVIALILYNENLGWFEDEFPSVRPFTPLYQHAQVQLNQQLGSNLSVWPANLRPSVAAEILSNYTPTPPDQPNLYTELKVHGSTINIKAYKNRDELYRAITDEITQPELAVEYLAANLERGVYRAHAENVGITWRALAAWHNQGIVSAHDIQKNPTAKSYVQRSAAYLPQAYELIYGCGNCQASAPR
jgi:hypothetical protein